ncbi:MAG TPA: hypothetical protein VI636_07040 [Candidatus Angelobacter sp.]
MPRKRLRAINGRETIVLTGMDDVKTRAWNILRALPLSQRQRELYERGVDAMDEAALEHTTSKLESALSRGPEMLAAARALLANRQPSPGVLGKKLEPRPELVELVRREVEQAVTRLLQDQQSKLQELVRREVEQAVTRSLQDQQSKREELVQTELRIAAASLARITSEAEMTWKPGASRSSPLAQPRMD